MSNDDMPACPVCGWHCKRVWRFSNNDCDAEAGRHADEFIAKLTKLPNVTASKGGAGYRSVYVKIVDKRDPERDASLFCVVNDEGSVGISSSFWPDGDPIDAVALIISAAAKAISGETS